MVYRSECDVRESRNQLLQVSSSLRNILQVKLWANTSHGIHPTTIGHPNNLFPKIARGHPSLQNLGIALNQQEVTLQDHLLRRNNQRRTHLRVTQTIPRYLLSFQSSVHWTSTLPNITFQSIHHSQTVNLSIVISAGRRISQVLLN